MCKPMLETGQCHFRSCKFSHDISAVRQSNLFYKTQMCDFHLRGSCKSGGACRYAHSEEEIRGDLPTKEGVEKMRGTHAPLTIETTGIDFFEKNQTTNSTSYTSPNSTSTNFVDPKSAANSPLVSAPTPVYYVVTPQVQPVMVTTGMSFQTSNTYFSKYLEGELRRAAARDTQYTD